MQFTPGHIDTSDEVLLNLTRYPGYQWMFRKSEILKTFPESLLATIIDQDPTTETITLDHPDAIPSAFGILYVILNQGGNFKPYKTHLTEMYTNPEIPSMLLKSSKYLLIPELSLFANPVIVKYLEVDTYSDFVNTRYVQSRSGYTLPESIIYDNYSQYTEYILRHTSSGGFPDLRYITGNSIYHDRLWAIQLFVTNKWVSLLDINLHHFPLESRDPLIQEQYSYKRSSLPHPILVILILLPRPEILSWVLQYVPSIRDDREVKGLDLVTRKEQVEVIKPLLTYNQYSTAEIEKLLDNLSRMNLSHQEIHDVHRTILATQVAVEPRV